MDHWPALLQAWVGEGEGRGLEALPRQCLHAVYGVEGGGDQKQCPPGHIQRHTIASLR